VTIASMLTQVTPSARAFLIKHLPGGRCASGLRRLPPCRSKDRQSEHFL